MKNILEIKNLTKFYNKSFKALENINLNIKEGEIFALLGPNGAGKSTLINSICGIVNFNTGTIKINNMDIIKNYRSTRKITGIVPQELNLETFETVWNNVNYTRGLFGKKPDHKYIEKLLRQLSLWDKKDNKIKELSGGMKRRVLIAKALSHQPKLLFLDEPTASVDVELRKDMWDVVKKLNKDGVTIILTTHYIEEAEELSDRVAVINEGKIILIDEKDQVLAYSQNSGKLEWFNKDFFLRELTSPNRLKSLVVYGDFQGFLHALDISQGEQVARKRVSRSKIISISTKDENVLTLDSKGKLSLFTLQ